MWLAFVILILFHFLMYLHQHIVKILIPEKLNDKRKKKNWLCTQREDLSANLSQTLTET